MPELSLYWHGMTTQTKKVTDGSSLSLDDWLQSISHPAPHSIVLDYAFPTEKHKQEYLATIAKRSELEVKELLRRFLVPAAAFKLDKLYFEVLKSQVKSGLKLEGLSEQQRKLLFWGLGAQGVLPWEGITWILDLCPWRPKDAVSALSAYLLAHIQALPDGRIDGLSDALEVIRSRYIGTPETNAWKLRLLLDLLPRQLECLVERTYEALGYRTMLTQPQKDGGRDVLAEHSEPGRREQLRIECKRYRGPVSVSVLRALLGVVSSEKANKGVLVTTGRFTRNAVDYSRDNPRLELVDGSTLVALMNEHLGSNWPTKIDRLVLDSERQSLSQSADECCADSPK